MKSFDVLVTGNALTGSLTFTAQAETYSMGAVISKVMVEIPVPFHPGALKFHKEISQIK
ncbi:MAG: hypothetical protein V7701_05760 [Sneathiella sp.]